MSDLLDEFNEMMTPLSSDLENAIYSDRKDRERIDELKASYAKCKERSCDQEVSLQARYDASKEVVSLLFSLDAYGALGDLSLDAGIATCRELHQQLELKKEYDAKAQTAG